MHSHKRFIIAAALIIGSVSQAAKPSHEMDRGEVGKIVNEMRQPLKPGEIGPRSLTDGTMETPDPTRPVPVTLPNGEQAYLVGLSGQHAIIVKKLSDLHSGTKELIDVELYNENGFRYGGEVDPQTGEPIGYALDSSTWDITVAHALNEDGKGTHMIVFAGAMGNDENGKPKLYSAGQWTRRRVFFHDVKFEIGADGKLKLVAKMPTSPLTETLPTGPDWVVKDKDGKILFSHGYGGEPVSLPNGDLYIDERGWVPVIHESVIEQRQLPDSDGKIRNVPYVTVLSVTYMDPTLTKVMQKAQTVLGPYKKDGKIWSAAQRPTLGPLVEGAHIDVQFKGKPVQSMAEVQRIRKAGGKFDFQMLFSAGEYYSHYGSFMAFAKGRPEAFEPVTDSKGELFNITANLSVLFVGEGRPVMYRDELGQLNLLMHGAARSGFPPEMKLNVPIKNKADWKYFNRELLNVPVKEIKVGKITILRPVDNSGIYRELRQYMPKLTPVAKPRDVDAKPIAAKSSVRRNMNCSNLFGRGA